MIDSWCSTNVVRDLIVSGEKHVSQEQALRFGYDADSGMHADCSANRYVYQSVLTQWANVWSLGIASSDIQEA